MITSRINEPDAQADVAISGNIHRRDSNQSIPVAIKDTAQALA